MSRMRRLPFPKNHRGSDTRPWWWLGAGSQVMSALVDVWGWRARLRLARGQILNDVIAKVPAIEPGLGTFQG